jgi:hypothetical protein
MPEHTGFIRGPLDDIRRLQDDLGDRYRQGFPILKELIQNADDAGATRVIIGLAPAVPGAHHPLLQGRGLFVANNGEFLPKHDLGIRRYGTSHKAAEEAAVGKFGLGMKSVFHLCEAFFYTGCFPGERPIARIVNPWSVPDGNDFAAVHPDWGPLTRNDTAALLRTLAPVLSSLTKPQSHAPFILWLPLRRDAHRRSHGRETGVIVPEFPGDEDRHLAFLLDTDLAAGLADLLPLLKTVTTIERRILTPDGPSDFQVTMDNDTPRLCFSETASPEPISGVIRIDGPTNTYMTFIAQEDWRWTRDLKALHQDPNWPKHPIQDDLGRQGVEPEKAQPHAALVVTTRPTMPGTGRLKLRWAVFLPLDDTLVGETIDCGGDRDFCLTLHGYFFVDAGRRGIHGFEVLGQGADGTAADATDEVRIRWNRAIATQGTLPLLLPVLDAFIAQLSPEAAIDTGERISRAIQNSMLWQRFCPHIAVDGQWVLRLAPDGPRWSLIEADEALLPLPRPGSPPDLPWQVFPALEHGAETVPVVADAAQLTARPATAPTTAQVEKLLATVEAKAVFAHRERLAYLLKTLAGCPEAVAQSAVQEQPAKTAALGPRSAGTA